VAVSGDITTYDIDYALLYPETALRLLSWLEQHREKLEALASKVKAWREQQK
jgi:hypothetical protein